jgi:hypothetical protein
MFMTRKRHWGLLLAALMVSTGLISSAVAGSDSDERKQEKQIRIFERVVDDMLVESPNWLVRSMESTQGDYIDGRGAVFSFKVDLNTQRWGNGDHWSYFHGDDDDSHVIVIRDDGRSKRHKEVDEDVIEREAKLYRRGKEEIVETIVDFGEMLTSLEDGDWIEIKGRLRGAKYFKENDLRKLSIKVKMADVRAHARGTLDEDDLVARIEIKES